MDTSNNQEQKKIIFLNKKFRITSLLQSGNKSKKSENPVISRVSRFSKSTLWYAYPWRDSEIYLFYVILAVAVPIVIKDISNKVILRANSRKNMSAEEK